MELWSFNFMFALCLRPSRIQTHSWGVCWRLVWGFEIGLMNWWDRIVKNKMQCKQASIASPSGIFTCSGPAEERVPVVHEATQIEDGQKILRGLPYRKRISWYTFIFKPILHWLRPVRMQRNYSKKGWESCLLVKFALSEVSSTCLPGFSTSK